MTDDLADLAMDGPVGDRVFCLVDRSRGRVLRTVENPSLLQAAARWEGGGLSVELNGDTLVGVPYPAGEMLRVDYWGPDRGRPRVFGPMGRGLLRAPRLRGRAVPFGDRG